jgi:DNA processing protein
MTENNTNDQHQMSELLYRVALTKIPKVGAVTAKNLIAHCGSAEAVFRTSRQNLLKIQGIGATIADYIQQTDVLQWAERELLFMEKHSIRALFHTDDAYPTRLREVRDCPMLLYYLGEADLNAKRIISIVGTRQPSTYGTKMCREIVDGLRDYKPLIVSGLAYGVDAIAHRQAVDSDLATVGVMGSGLQRVYPNEHRELARLMLEKGGGLLTEYPSDQAPEAMHFPMRNRIIAGMCDATIIIESAQKGGSMITAYLARDFSRDLLAVPGRSIDSKSKGCNTLIKSQVAAMVESADDIAKALRWDELDNKKGKQAEIFFDLSDTERQIVDVLRQNEQGASIDFIGYETQMSPTVLAATLLNLEIRGVLRSLTGRRYALA